jgi:hypothetical protein
MTPEIFISYAWRDREKDPSPDDRESIVDTLCATLQGSNLLVRRDKTQITYKDSIGDFMRNIGAANRAIVVVSDKYLRSRYCMYEAIEVLNHRNLDARLFPLVLDDAKIHDPIAALDYVAYWEQQVADLEAALSKVKNETAKFRYQSELRDLKDIAEKIQDFMTWIADKNTLSASVHLATRFEELVQQLASAPAAPVAHTAGPIDGPGPVFSKIDLRYCNFLHALRPAQTKLVVSKLPTAINLIAPWGWGGRRLLDDIQTSGIKTLTHIVQVKLSHYLTDYQLFVKDIVTQSGIVPLPTDSLKDIFRATAQRHGKPVLFILESVDSIFNEKADLDARYDLGFLHQLRSLKESDFMCLLLKANTTINRRSFKGDTSPLWVDDIELNALGYEDLQREVARRLPTLAPDLSGFIVSQLEFEPRETYDLLDRLLSSLESRSTITREMIGAELIRLKSKQ